jgi:hypothetical protein
MRRHTRPRGRGRVCDPQPLVAPQRQRDAPRISAASETLLNMLVCRFGAEDVGPRCGAITSTKVQLRHQLSYRSDGQLITVVYYKPPLFEVSACAKEGDLGGPRGCPDLRKSMVKPCSKAVGTLAGGLYEVTSCAHGPNGPSYFAPVAGNEGSLQRVGLQLKVVSQPKSMPER